MLPKQGGPSPIALPRPPSQASNVERMLASEPQTAVGSHRYPNGASFSTRVTICIKNINRVQLSCRLRPPRSGWDSKPSCLSRAGCSERVKPSLCRVRVPQSPACLTSVPEMPQKGCCARLGEPVGEHMTATASGCTEFPRSFHQACAY